jgi:hypothetical protein
MACVLKKSELIMLEKLKPGLKILFWRTNLKKFIKNN